MTAPAEATRIGSETRSILIVDDDPSVADTFGRLLAFEGYRVHTASDPEAGLALAGEIRPDAILLDFRMPIVNGLEFLRRVRAQPELAGVAVAIVTGDYFIEDDVAAELVALGAALRFKPVFVEDLLKIARMLLAS